MSRVSRYLPFLQWGRGYDGAMLTGDLVAAVIVTIVLIPQSLASAMLAGLPAAGDAGGHYCGHPRLGVGPGIVVDVVLSLLLQPRHHVHDGSSPTAPLGLVVGHIVPHCCDQRLFRIAPTGSRYAATTMTS